MNLIGHFIADAAGCQGANLLQGGIPTVKYSSRSFLWLPYALQHLNALHLQEYLDGIGHGLAVGWRNLNHSQPGHLCIRLRKSTLLARKAR